MSRLIRFLDRILTPVLILGYLAFCVVLLAISPGPEAFLSMLWAVAMMAALRWGIWGILSLSKRTAPSPGALKGLVRTVEGMMLLLVAASVFFAVLLRDIPAVWLLIPAALYGLRGAIHFDAMHLQ